MNRPTAPAAPAARRAPARRGSAPPPRSPVHPERYRRRRRLAVALGGLVLLGGLVAGGRALLLDAGLADVEAVEVSGVRTVALPDVLAAVEVEPGGPLAAVDTAAVTARVARLPGVAAVEVSRGWPHTVVVAVTERVPVVVADTAAGPFLVDGTGVPYLPAPAAVDLPRLTVGAVGPDDPSTRAALAVLGAVPEPVRVLVRTVAVAPFPFGGSGIVTLGLTEDREVRWGTPERTAEKAAVLGPLLTRPGRVYDVTSPDLPTVRR